jgi:nitroimidazol reductase NimA-like FMN-containing flavoprotein (pyridoxamine 5'-phosphate oxidase superfamily)
MSKDYSALPLNQVRRADRAVEDESWIRAVLRREPVGVLAMTQDDQPLINSNLFVYDETRHCIYMHTARVGRTRAAIEHNPRVCFSVMRMGRLLPAAEALEFSVEYESVVVFGTAQVIDAEDEALYSLQRLLNKYAPHLQPGVDYRPPVVEELARTAVYRIAIESWSGKKKAVAADFPGAYWYSGGESSDRP